MQFINFFVAFCPCILNIYGRLVRCNVSTDPFLYLCLYVLIDAIYTFFVAFCLCILNIYGRLVRCNASTDAGMDTPDFNESSKNLFSTTNYTSFCRHLEENVRRLLQDKVCVPAEVRQDTVRRVFGAERLAGGRFRATLDASERFLV